MEKVLELPDRLRKIIEFYGLNVNELASKLGGSRMKYYNLLNGKAKPDFDTTETILKHFSDISAEWFMRGDGSMLKSEIATLEDIEKVKNENLALQSLYEKAAIKISSMGKTKGTSNHPQLLLDRPEATKALQNSIMSGIKAHNTRILTEGIKSYRRNLN